MDEFVGTVDDKGRILIPAEVRAEQNIGPKDEIACEIKLVRHKKNFVEVCEGCLEGFADDPVKLMHEAFAHEEE
ncbi:MAG: AbrB/MazE/SpoVT family DNA-binding domain-containing protein [Methanosarcinales archaeon]|nr:MAG: AbrB/MazE/SpoVT family DNA-binding domain-containing protein [Methanosarcinales archaeon]